MPKDFEVYDHTDSAKEQKTTELKAFFDSNGTAATQMMPKASKSNAFAERRFRQLMVEERTAMAEAHRMSKNLWSFAVLGAANKSNYMATAKIGQLETSPSTRIKQTCSKTNIPIGIFVTLVIFLDLGIHTWYR